jgi:hypothetical protein
MLKISNVKVNLNETRYAKIISTVLNVREKEIRNVKLLKQSVDARRNKIHFICSFAFDVDNEDTFLQQHKKHQLSLYKPYKYQYLPKNNRKTLVVGSGPAGLFCAYVLAMSGNDVTLIERGKKVEERMKDIDSFLNTGIFNKDSNIAFGEGGAGTFSDGKLTTGIKNKRIEYVLQTFVEFGAPKDILYLSKPHIGTDYLRDVVKNIRNKLIELGGKVYFETKYLDFEKINNQYKVFINKQGRQEEIIVDDLVLAIGHSARDTYESLYHNPYITMTPKSFAVGVRIEQNQQKINQIQYHQSVLPPQLKAANYKLAVQTKEKRGVYTFCMCPGGYVVPSSSEEGYLCINGMSEYKRDGHNANSAILVTVNPSDYESDHPLAGVEFQRKIEKKAFELSNSYKAPVQLVNDYLNNTVTKNYNKVISTYRPQTIFSDINKVFPEFINRNLKEGLILMNKKMPGFIDEDTLLVGVETRSSAPIRIERNQNYAIENEHIYPIGEGAGWAGGIMSSAIDGIMCAESILKGE